MNFKTGGDAGCVVESETRSRWIEIGNFDCGGYSNSEILHAAVIKSMVQVYGNMRIVVDLSAFRSSNSYFMLAILT